MQTELENIREEFGQLKKNNERRGEEGDSKETKWNERYRLGERGKLMIHEKLLQAMTMLKD